MAPLPVPLLKRVMVLLVNHSIGQTFYVERGGWLVLSQQNIDSGRVMLPSRVVYHTDHLDTQNTQPIEVGDQEWYTTRLTEPANKESD